MDINFVPLKISNDENVPTYLYTQAQAKQLNLNAKPNFSKNDFIFAVNNFKIDPDGMEKFAKKRYTRFIIHEIIHGMGFTSNEVISELKDTDEVVPISPGHFSTDGSDKYKFLPSLSIDMRWDKLSNAKAFEEYINGLYDSKLRSVSPLTVFSKYIVDIETKENLFEDLGFLYKDYDCFDKDLIIREITSKKCYKCYNELNEKNKKAMDNITNHFLKSQSIGFLTNRGTVVPLQTFTNEFHPGSSIVHTQFNRYDEIRNDPDSRKKFVKGTFINKENIFDYYDKEALMYYSQTDSITDDVFIETVGKDNHEGIIGQGILDILKTLGWNEKGDKRSDDVYYYDDTIFVPSQNTFKFVNMKLYELTVMPPEHQDQQEPQEQEQEQEQQQEQAEPQKEQKQEQEQQATKKSKETVIPPKEEL